MAKLIVRVAEQTQFVELRDTNTIGRHADNAIRVFDRLVSKHHAEIVRRDDGRYVIRDLGSRNGLVFNGQRTFEHVFDHGDVVDMGGVKLEFVATPDSEVTLSHVTVDVLGGDSVVRQSIEPDTERVFLPAAERTDDKELIADYERLRLRHEIDIATRDVWNTDELLPLVLRRVFQLVAADNGVVFRYDAEGKLVAGYVERRHGKGEGPVRVSRTILAEVERTRQALLCQDVTIDDRFAGRESIVAQGIRSVLAVPLVHGGEMLGVIHMDSRTAANAFSNRDLEILVSIAGQTAQALHTARLVRRLEDEAHTRAQFQRLLSPNLVEQLVTGRLKLERGGELRDATILFADIRGFTAMSEAMSPVAVVHLLNEYFELMVDVLFQHDGTLDKYIGDCVMALFGAPIAMPNGPLQAVRCAWHMQQALRELNETRLQDGLPAIHVGIGVNTGPVVAGAMGSSRTLQYTAVGDAVNVASRLCSIAGAFEVLISEATYARIENAVDVLALPPVQVKGKAQPMRVYCVQRVDGVADERDDTTGPAL
ncbi:MAG: GAF domain-containing protein [Deltaproteobacteria bacterium]|nr:GAF domain-containing protein [Deltaproteobacteria bacterium]